MAWWLARGAGALQFAGSIPASPDFLFLLFICSSGGKFQTSPDSVVEIANEKGSLSWSLFPAKKKGIFVITYNVRGFSAKKHATSAPDGQAPSVEYTVNTSKTEF